MSTIFKIVSGLLLGVILFQFISHSCEARKWRKSEAFLNAALDSCFNAKPQIDTIWHFKTLRDTIKLKYNYTVTDTFRVSQDSIIEEREYRGTYNSDLLALRWRAVVIGELRGMEILPTSSYRFPEIRVNRVVQIPSRTTTINKEKSHLWFTAGYYHPVMFNGGLMYIRKEGWGLSAGISVTENKLYYGGGLIIKLK